MPVRFRVRAAAPGASSPVERVVDVGDPDPAAPPLREIRIGRGPDVELPLPFAGLAPVHARLRRAGDGGGWLLEDAGGPPRALARGAAIDLGSVTVVFEGEEAVAAPAGPAAAEGTGTIARRLVRDLFAGAPAGSTPELEVVAGPEPGQRLALAETGRPYLVGRGTGCALPLVIDEISREHAVFVWTDQGVVVRDLGSKNGVLVAGTRVATEQRLRHGDLVALGPVTLRLRDPIDRYLAEIAAGAPATAPPPDPAPAVAPVSDQPPAMVTGAAVRAGSRVPIALAAVAVAVLVAVAAAAVALIAG